MLSNSIIKYFAKKHIAGSSLNDALKVCRWANQKNWFATISAWTSEKETYESNANRYYEIVNAIIVEGFNSYVSIKPSAINFKLTLFERIAEKASLKNIRIHFDSLSPDIADKSIKFLREAKSIYNNVGYTIASRWGRSLIDVKEIIKLQIPVRIVKGQWPDIDHLKINAKNNYINILKNISEKAPLIVVATHDYKLAQEALNILENGKNNFELEQFFSLPLNGIELAKSFKAKYGIYIAYGEPYLPYNIKNANKRPAMLFWLVRDILNIRQKYILESSFINRNSEL